MNERVLEIVVFMVSRLRGAVGEVAHYNQLAIDLQSRGFTEREINLACSWMFDRYGAEVNTLSKTAHAWKSSVRILSPRERIALSSQAVGYLMQLVKLGILRATDFEEVVEACAQSGRHAMCIDEMKSIISGALFSEHGAALNRPGMNVHGDDSSFAN
jgi:uncharacterized protein Smg (DUF494 family)